MSANILQSTVQLPESDHTPFSADTTDMPVVAGRCCHCEDECGKKDEASESDSGQIRHNISAPMFPDPEDTYSDALALCDERLVPPPVPTVSRYRQEFTEIRRLGRGGFGSVWLVKNRLDGCEYAVKRIRFVFRNDGHLNEQLRREVTVLASLDHPNVVRYHYAWIETDNNTPFLPSPLASSAPLLCPARVAAASRLCITNCPNDDSGCRLPKGNGHQKPETCTFLGDIDDDESDDGIEARIRFCDPQSPDSRTSVQKKDSFGSFCDDSCGSDSCDSEHSLSQDDTESEGENENDDAQVAIFPMEDTQSLFSADKKSELESPQKRADRLAVETRFLKSTLFIQMHFYNQTLSSWLENPRRKSVCPHVSLSIFIQITEALRYIHSKGIIHRDLKPANIFLTPRESSSEWCSECCPSSVCHCPSCRGSCGPGFVVSVGDFGLSTFINSSSESHSDETLQSDNTTQSSPPSPCLVPRRSCVPNGPRCVRPEVDTKRLTLDKCSKEEMSHSLPKPPRRSFNPSKCEKHTTGVGTLSYASPEQLKRGRYNTKTDIFSLGLILYQLFMPCFSTVMERMIHFEQIRGGVIPSIFASHYPRHAELIKACVSYDPLKRPSAAEILRFVLSGATPALCMFPVPSVYLTSAVAKRESLLNGDPVVSAFPNDPVVTVPRSVWEQAQEQIRSLQQQLNNAKAQLGTLNASFSEASSSSTSLCVP